MAASARAVIVLLRGINVGGKNKLPMAVLREVATGCGHGAARTYIQSGNLVLPTARGDLDSIGRSLGAAITERTGLDIALILRTAGEWTDVIAANPFADAAAADGRTVHVIFLAASAPDPLVTFDAASFAPDEVAVHDREVYLHTPDGLGRSKLAQRLNAIPGASSGTARNWNTVLRLASLAAET